jgi:hypothetical protein
MTGERSVSLLNFEAYCEHAFEFSKHVSEFTNERRPDGPIATALIDIIDTARDSSNHDEFYAFFAHIEAFADHTPTGILDVLKTSL